MFWRKIKSYLAIETNPNIVQYVQTTKGKLLLILLFSLALALYSSVWWPDREVPILTREFHWWPVVIAALTAMTFLPQYRRVLLVLASLYGLTQLPWFDWKAISSLAEQDNIASPHALLGLHLLSLFIAFFFTAIFIYCAKRYSKMWLMRHPIISLLTIIFTLMIVASYFTQGLLKLYLWSSLIPISTLTWFIAYALLDLKNLGQQKKWKQFSHYLPFWGSTTTPFPKGSAYLRKIEAKNAEQLAISQLRGIKLIFWSLVLVVIFMGILALYYFFHIPTLKQAFAQCAKGHPYPWYKNWESLIIIFFAQLAVISINGHIIIAICRMAGFNALRNTYRPLSSPNIAEFWNRYYFYFKELLVEIFFYPSYFKCFKSRPKLRLFFATMMAACVGNILYHVIAYIQYPIHLGLFQALKEMSAYILYAFVLGIAIAFSQLRNLNRTPAKGLRRWLITPIIVLSFYLLMTIFNRPFATTNIHTNFLFIMSLFH